MHPEGLNLMQKFTFVATECLQLDIFAHFLGFYANQWLCSVPPLSRCRPNAQKVTECTWCIVKAVEPFGNKGDWTMIIITYCYQRSELQLTQKTMYSWGI